MKNYEEIHERVEDVVSKFAQGYELCRMKDELPRLRQWFNKEGGQRQ